MDPLFVQIGLMHTQVHVETRGRRRAWDLVIGKMDAKVAGCILWLFLLAKGHGRG